jgi:hypothetical protein
MQKFAQAMRRIKPIITKVKLGVAIDKVPDPEITITQIDRYFAPFVQTQELALNGTGESVFTVDIHRAK